VIFGLVLATSCFSCTRKDFENFKSEYKKSYADAAEENKRFGIFCKNALKAHKLQLQADEEQPGQVEFGITKFTDLTDEEFKCYLGYKPSNKSRDIPDGAHNLQKNAPPKTFDWRSKDAITPVKNQGQCGSCWAFSATENIESSWFIQGKNTLTELSVEQIVQCDKTDGGCNGGDTTTAYDYVKKAGGLESQEDYPYTSGGGTTGRCSFDSKDIVAKITGYEFAGKGDESGMVSYLAEKGPISICVDASNWSPYKKGIYPASQCGKSLDHCVLAVGYDLDNGYWIVRNSWGSTWGESGYIYLEYGKDACGLTTEPTNSLV
jgi:C1A family cysteine protease